jgi:hypothetical protein
LGVSIMFIMVLCLIMSTANIFWGEYEMCC